MKLLSRLVNTGAGVSQSLLILLYISLSAAGAALVVFLLYLGAEFFYSIDWWILGAILRVGEWLVAIPAAFVLLLGIGFSLFTLMKAIFVGKGIE